MSSGLISTPKEKMNNQYKTPLADALERECLLEVIPYDVPGHKGNSKSLKEFFGERAVMLDKNSRPQIDNLNQPTGAIKEAEELASLAFGARKAYFMVNGTTSTVQAMIMSAVRPGEKIILPRNVHVSVINAVIIAGGVPVFVNPGVDEEFGVALGMSKQDVVSAIEKNSEAVAILVNNPTYYGICSPLEKIVEEAHKRGMLVLVDEAHGTHFYFGEDMPISAMQAGADMSAVSMHKTGGSLTQSSLLLIGGDRVDEDYVRNIINLTQTTSASYLLMASIDIARRDLAIYGKERFKRLKQRTQELLREIAKIDGFEVFSKENLNYSSVSDFDPIKISVNTSGTGLAGIEVYNILREEFNIQLEFGDVSNFLAIPTVEDEEDYGKKLVEALKIISKKYSKKTKKGYTYEYIQPIIKIPPRDAFYYPHEKVSLPLSEGRISGQFVMCYPPGIPLLSPGELITKDVIEHILYSEEKGCKIIGASGQTLDMIQLVK